MSGIEAPGGAWFVSHAGADRPWAEWAAWQLIDAGFQVELDYWDWGAGDNFILKMNDALERGRFLALFSPAYFEPDRFTTPEWTAIVAMKEKITPVRVAKVVSPAILRPLIARNLFGLGEDAARRELLDAVNGPRRPTVAPAFPGALRQLGGSGPRLPGSLPRVWNLPTRNASFTGRNTLVVRLRQTLAASSRVAVQALHGRGGVGKTQLAVEYAHRFAGEYELCWWVAAEDPALIPDQLAQLATRIGAAPAGAPSADAVDALLGELRTRSRWLLVFDNIEDPAALTPYLPGGGGHVLITSRNPHWHAHASPLNVDVFTRAESVALLHAHGAVLGESDADHLAQALDDLPLAVAQAAALLTGGLSAADLTAELARSTAEVLAQGHPVGYPVSLAAQVRLTTTRLESDHPGAAALLSALALLAPEPFPVTTCAGHLPDHASLPLTDALADRLRGSATLHAITRHSLARAQDGTVQLHRLTQTVLRDQLTSDQRRQAGRDVEALLTAAAPGDVRRPSTWPGWRVLLPHLLAVDPILITTETGRDVVRDACWYLLDRGQARPARDRLQQLHFTWSRQLGPDHEGTLWTAHYLARAHGDSQDHARARALDEDALQRRRRLLGEDHRDTLTSASNLALRLAHLGQTEEARALDEDTLTRQRRALGEDHPDTLTTASNLALRLADVGQREEARALGEDTLTRRRRVLGEDHPDTLRSASNLALRLAALRQTGEARALGEDTLTRQRRALGEDHPDTLTSASNLAIDLAALGHTEEARALDEDTLTRRRRVLGEDHPDTLRSASNLALRLAELGQTGEARALGEDTLTRRRRVLGEDHPDTLRTANNLAIDLADGGQTDEARALDEDTLTRRRQVLGEDHPDTLTSANNLAIRLAELGQTDEARILGEDTLTRSRRVLGEDHPDTLRTARFLEQLDEAREDPGIGK
ncbi:FxSxx-COOH system tetratricopeptide repeat protein [Streptomyces sp. NPDC058572]|uniref:FxSxx-COOH system tetratricopeptide repeat protein n=1 Tax=Streptomyces sp. NPDC058572 TaxID=3346546 RepID=UPI003657C26F